MLKLLRTLLLSDRQLLVLLQEAYTDEDKYYLCHTISGMVNIWPFQRKRLKSIVFSHIDPGHHTLNGSSFARATHLEGRPLRLFFLQTLIEDLKDRDENIRI